MNDAIEPELCLMSYTTVEKVAWLIMQLGEKALMENVDIDAA